jgi:hypothetical protein
MNHEDLEELDLVFLTEVPTSPDDIKKVVRPKKNVSIATLDQDHPRYEFEISYGISDADDLSVSNEPIIIVREKDAIDVDSNDDKNGQDGKRKLIYGIFCVFLLIMIPIGIVVGLRSKNTENSVIPSKSIGIDSRVDNSSHVPSLSPSMPSEQQQSKNPTIAPINPTVNHSISSSSPSMSPTRTTPSPSTLTTSPSFSPVLETSKPLSGMPSPSIRPAFQMIAQVLSLDGDKLPRDKESPSYQAVSFLAEEFEATGSLLKATRLGQRYALASIYYSTRGSNWRNQLDFITSFHECDWNYSKNNITKGVICGLDGIVKSLHLRKSVMDGLFFSSDSILILPLLCVIQRTTTYRVLYLKIFVSFLAYLIWTCPSIQLVAHSLKD